MPDEMPAYFQTYLTSFNAACAQQKSSSDALRANQQEILVKVSLFSDRVPTIASSIDLRFASVSSEVAAVRNDITALTLSSTLTDALEVLISGVPSSLRLPDVIIFLNIVAAMNLLASASQFLETRA